MNGKNCLFCRLIAADSDRIVAQNKHAFVIEDAFPVTELHCLVIPKRHVESYFDLQDEEILAIHHLLEARRETIESESQEPVDFNVGVNCGRLAGQTVFHCHVHLFPRRHGDIANPEGGVRNVVPGKGPYQKPENTGDSLTEKLQTNSIRND